MRHAQAKWQWRGLNFSYILTDEDVLNLARAVQAEGAPQEMVLWTLLQRFAVLYAAGNYSSLTEFLQAYVQPINPRWFPIGSLHLERVHSLEAAGRLKEAEAERAAAKTRIGKAAKRWEEISPTTKKLVEEVLAGERTSPLPSSLHYWASRASKDMDAQEQKAYNAQLRPGLKLLDAGTGYGPGVNVFFSVDGSKHLKGLTIGPGGTTGKIGGIVAVALLSYLAYRIWG